MLTFRPSPPFLFGSSSTGASGLLGRAVLEVFSHDKDIEGMLAFSDRLFVEPELIYIFSVSSYGSRLHSLLLFQAQETRPPGSSSR